MALPAESPSRRVRKGQARPRLAPPTPARSGWREFHDLATDLELKLYPWQDTAARYLTALGPDERWLYPEVAIIVGRQSGKTTLLEPLIVSRLLAGQRIMHTAQNRELPREVHDRVATLLVAHYPERLPKRRGIRYGAGQEEIRLTDGGRYRIVAPTRGGARGPANDLVIIDELREMEDHDFIAAAEPTLSASPNPQMVYLSNAGEDKSEVLNALRRRADTDPALAYLEWSAGPERPVDDVAGWLEANPDVGHNPTKFDYLARKLTSYTLAGQLAIFETEHLCRWVRTMAEPIIAPEAWAAAEKKYDLLRPIAGASLGIALDPLGTRASGVIAWQDRDGSLGLRVIADVTGDPIDIDRFGPALRRLGTQVGAKRVVFDPYDEHLARHFTHTKAMNGRDYANASATFVRLLEAGSLHWQRDPQVGDAIGGDIPNATRRSIGPGAWLAVKSRQDKPATALLAAIRAVGDAYRPTPAGGARIY